MPRIHVTLPDGSEVTHELTEDVVSVGRISENTIQIEDASVSSHHAELVLREGDYALTDLGSTNGTRLNGKSLAADEEMQLQDNDRIRFGNIDVVYLSENPADQRPLPEGSEPVLAPAETSVRPADFSNASPFQTKRKKKEPAALAIYGVAVLGFLAFAAAVASVFSMKSPL